MQITHTRRRHTIRLLTGSILRLLNVWHLLFFAMLIGVAVWLSGPGAKLFQPATAAFATTYFVRTDGSNVACNGQTNASAAPANQPNCAFQTIQFAVNTAVAGDTINVAAGTYNESQVLIQKSVSVIGAGAATTIIDGGDISIATTGMVRIDLPVGDTGNVLFTGFTLTNPGVRTGSTSRYHIFAKPNSPLSTITISNNKIAGIGMVGQNDYGLYSDHPSGKVVFDHNELTNNQFNPILIERPVGETDVHHNTISGNASTAYFNFTYQGDDVTSKQRVADNTISASAASAITFNSASGGGSSTGRYTNVEITNNIITQLGGSTNRTGITLFNQAAAGNGALGAIENPTIIGNSITGIDTVTSNGIRLRGLVTNANIKSNNVRDVDRAVWGEVVSGHSATGTEAHFNNFVSNVSGFIWDGSSPVNAENNWWGCNYGPGAGGAGCSGTANGIGGTGAANVDADPWLVLGITASPNAVMVGGTSTLTADLTKNSTTAASGGFVPNGTPVTFAGVLGTVMPTNTTTTSGLATSTYTATAPGAGSGSSTVDQQTVSAPITVTAPCGITCPANQTVSNDPNQCGAVVNYPAPTTTGTCNTVTCNPPSGSFFPKGTTTVTCQATGAPAPSCSFTVTVNDTQPPTITCPASFAIGTDSATGRTVTYSPPTASDNCPGVTVACNPLSGANYPVGTTTVTCTATDASSNTATCSFTITVNRVSFAVADPLACTGPGNVVTGTFSITNNGAASVAVTATVALPAGLVGVPNTCTANVVTTCTVSATSVNYTATLAPGQTATVNYQAQVGDVAPGTTLCSNLVVTFGSGPSFTVPACTTVNCPAAGPGLLFPATAEVGDQKAGSVLVYNLYSSSIAAPNQQNTRIAITNTNPGLSIAVHLFFVDGATCSIADSLVCLTPNQTASFLASDIDPGTTGYIVAVASDLVTGCPVNFNYLIGDEYVKLSSGHAANLAAEAFASLAGSLPACNGLSVTALLSFDGTSYNRAPRVLAASNLPSRADGNDTLIVLNRVGGSLAAGAATLGSLFGILYDDAENPLSFTFTAGVCQFRSSLSSNFPRVAPRFEQFIAAGRSGWAKFYSQSDIALLGAQINFNANAGTAANAFNQGHNLHKLTLTTAATLTIPIFPPNC